MERGTVPSANMAGASNKQTSYLHPSLRTTRTMPRQSAGGKDLIIRMLAEVFRVGLDEDGQVRWQQISSSLVPVSLYSRSTKKWLDYMLSASSMAGANDPANAMSPDSRDFLLLLQQFHQQPKSLSFKSKQQLQANFNPQQLQDFIIFQIVGHDFINGQCKKILNIKIAQPGTRLGRASDYFVYWKEQATCGCFPSSHHQDHRLHRNFLQMQQFSTSIASSNSFMPGNHRQQQHADTSPSHHRTCCGQSQTWGLNFASINDAKLFYDICSLNLVDLDFNSDYLKQNMLSDRYQSAINQNASTISPGSLILNQRSRKMQQARQQQQQQQQQQTTLRDRSLQRTREAATLSRLQQRNSIKRQSSISKCPSCKQLVKAVRSVDSKQFSNTGDLMDADVCPVHGHQTAVDSMRVRSRSTTRHPGRPSSEMSGILDKRMRSYSTPASPENECPVHRRRHRLDTDCEELQAEEVHQTRCSNYDPQNGNETTTTIAHERPRKPARGLLRATLPGDQGGQNYLQHHRDVVSSSQALHTRRVPKTKYVGHSTSFVASSHDRQINNNNNNLLGSQENDPQGSLYLAEDHSHSTKQQQQQQQQQLPANLTSTTRTGAGGYRSSLSSHHMGVQEAPIEPDYDPNNLHHQHRLNNSSHFDSIAHRDARLARARYANSRDLKEFLSLDGGCLQNNHHQTPNGQRFRRQTEEVPRMSSLLADKKQDSMKQRTQMSGKQSASKPMQKQQSKGGQSKERNYSSDTERPANNIGLAKNNRDVRVAGLEGANCSAGGSNNPVRTVSTTTDDLPLDAQTRKRMLKLTSDEVISERTEPQSCSGPATVGQHQQQQQQQQQHQQLKLLSQTNDNIDKELGDGRLGSAAITRIRDDKIDRQARAVSLGPEFDGSGAGAPKPRGQAARSDAGRRRSLERSTCVDLDPPLPASSFKKFVRLSPLSASPMVPEAATRRDSPLDRPSISRDNGQADGNEPDGQRADLSDDLHHRYVRHHGQQQQQHQQRLGRLDPSWNVRRDNSKKWRKDDADQADDGPRHFDTCQHQRSEWMSSMFKSAPDISSLLSTVGPVYATSGGQATSTGHVKSDTRDLANVSSSANWMDQRRLVYLTQPKLARTMPKRTSTRSSYAVPLCSGDPDHYDQRQRHHYQQYRLQSRGSSSCPSSLRRKRKLAPTPADLYAPIGQPLGPANLISDCLCAHCAEIVRSHDHRPMAKEARRARYDGLGNQSHARGNGAHLLHCPDCNSIFAATARQDQQQQLQHPPYHDHNRQQQQEWLYRPSQHLDNNNLSDAIDGGAEAARFLASSRWPSSSSSQQFKRPPSSQSNRSPLHYGLYESDYEDQVEAEAEADEDEEEEGEEDVDEDFLDDYGAGRCGSSAAHLRWTEYCRDTFDRAVNTSIHFNSCPGEPVKPVQGYDQTMSRSSLKLRQRSRSQPPKISPAVPDDEATYLSKSVENVEKLIKEVQLELDSLKRLPIGAASIGLNDTGAIPTTGSAPAKSKPTGRGAPGATDPGRMSIEENLAEGRGQQQDLATGERPARLTTSATRRAGQFKCAGAIRKAGFLSVKKWILRRRQSIELARKQGWKRYWVCLRGTALLFHSVIDKTDIGDQDHQNNQNQTDLLSWIDANCGSRMQMVTDLLKSESQQQELAQDVFLNNISQCYIEKEPKHLIIIDGAIAQPIPEHPRRDFVFCLSTTFGDAYLFQSGCQLESDNWISAIHNACAASIARDLTRDEATKLFETKIRHLELEAEKKLFLRQRLESRLTSMSSMSKSLAASETDDEICKKLNDSRQMDAGAQGKKVTLRSLLHRLSQQLLALDTFSEQLHCEVYQLRCYLSSCGNQQLFYQNIQRQAGSSPVGFANNAADLPHPKSLLMHVSKATKLLLIKLGVFTVSSFHAYIHARQESADSIVQKLQQQQLQSSQSSCPSSPLELRIRSHSISQNLLGRTENIQLDNDTEELIEMASLRSVTIKLSKSLYAKIRGCADVGQIVEEMDDTSDDRYSIRDGGDQTVVLNMRLQTSSTSTSIIKQLLKIIEPNLGEFEFLNYYLRLIMEPQVVVVVVVAAASCANNDEDDSATIGGGQQFHPIKRKETLADWNNFKHLELLEKKLFRVELNRSRMDEDASTPFGISLEGQLFIGKFESLLNVYCSYIEWGSVADKSGLRDEDEFVMINGIPLGDLDMMFVECLMQDASKLKIVVRSNRTDSPPSSISMDHIKSRPSREGDDDDDEEEADDYRELERQYKQVEKSLGAGSSQIISDEHITSLVCPPPPAQSDAFLRTDPSLVRQKSDLDVQQHTRGNQMTRPIPIPKSKSQHRLDNSPINTDFGADFRQQVSKTADSGAANGDELARQLIRKTERITKLLGREQTPEVDTRQTVNEQTCPVVQKCDQALVERLKKSLLELLETEYAYIRHLETIVEHYMTPMKESAFLDINDLRLLHGSCLHLLTFQRDFFELLTSNMTASCQLEPATQLGTGATDDYETLNRIINYINSLVSLEQLTAILGSVSRVFLLEADKFKNYAEYCVAYSRLQRILHPKGVSGSNLPCSSITSIPAALNTFSSSTTSMITPTANANSCSSSQQSVKLMSSLLSATGNGADLSSQLRKLTDFLANLDSSSSSVSLSLPRSSGSEHAASNSSSARHLATKSPAIDKSTTSMNAADTSLQKSVHQQNFESYLIKPIQRIVKYPMLLNSIAVSVQNFADSYGDLICAVRQMESIIGHVNDTQRIHDEYGHIFDHIERQYFEQQAQEAAKWTGTASPSPSLFGPHQPPISLNIAQLLYFGSVEWLNMHEFTSKIKKSAILSQVLFVFNSCVVFICKEQVRSSGRKRMPLASVGSQQSTSSLVGASSSGKITNNNNINGNNNNNQDTHEIIRYQTLIPVKEVQVRSVAVDSKSGPIKATGGSQGDRFQWEMFQCSSSNSNSSLLTKTSGKRNNNGKMYLLASPSNEERSAFLRKIRFTIRESVRNMSLPLARSPSSKSLTSTKKMSTSSTDSASNTNTNSSCSASFSPESNLSRDLSHQVVGRPSNAAPEAPQVAASDNRAFNKSTKFENGIQVNN